MTMADAGTLHDAFVDELRNAYDAEKQITKAVPKMVKAASSPEFHRQTRLNSERRGTPD
jgi:ferritin-like metal-binding protein YciE